MDELNPYAAPEIPRSDVLVHDPEEGRGVWRDGPVLVMSRFARLPSRCVKCNAPATIRLERSLSWHPWALYLVIPLTALGPIAYLVLFFIYRRTARVEVPLCNRHRARRRRDIAIACLGGVVGLTIAVTPGLGEGFEGLTWPGIAFFLASLAFGLARGKVVRARQVDRNHVWVAGIGTAYLGSLSPLPRPEAEF